MLGTERSESAAVAAARAEIERLGEFGMSILGGSIERALADGADDATLERLVTEAQRALRQHSDRMHQGDYGRLD